ncbi:MAG TPA: hypothetical protein RMH99_22595 [Sandaracinaceae bacterium LLY-WYZ-13_1]|nr:hypothetical protein [Sandaracinaceae bacterium LLY-WYZ-13_1]
MTRWTRRLAGAAALAALGAVALTDVACSSIGDPGGTPDGLPHGGTGQFRLLESEETGISGPLDGRAIVLIDRATESGMATGDFLFYAQAPLLEEPPELPDDHPRDEIFWPAFEARRIHRGEVREEGVGAYDFGPEVLAASEGWEGGEVYDPWVAVDDDGTARLYYAAAGGIGVAEASSVDGSFAKVAGPVLDADDVGGEVPRRPSVVRGVDGAWWMYFSAGGALGVARSEDGTRFTVQDGLRIDFAEGEADMVRSPEVARIHPGAVRVETPAERTLIRLYFESVREDGTHRVYVAGSDDGLTFERHPLPAMEQTEVRFPAPRVLDPRVTLLYASFPFFGAGVYQTRAITVAVAPADESFVPEEEEAE